ncbi:MAG: adenylate kinase family protein [Candidatus Aenigmatarchaeota archaeon]
MIVVIVGPPASGKGTVSVRLAKKLGLEHISTGDIFRNLDDSEIAKYLVTGRLLPDELVAKVVNKAMEGKTKIILDGYPRNLAQAKLLDGYLAKTGRKIDRVVFLDTSTETVVRRMTNRRICPKCGKVYNLLTLPPPKPGKCECGGDLIQRPDDNEKTIVSRVGVFEEHTKPILEHYKGRVLKIDGNGEIDGIIKELSKKFGK